MLVFQSFYRPPPCGVPARRGNAQAELLCVRVRSLLAPLPPSLFGNPKVNRLPRKTRATVNPVCVFVEHDAHYAVRERMDEARAETRRTQARACPSCILIVVLTLRVSVEILHLNLNLRWRGVVRKRSASPAAKRSAAKRQETPAHSCRDRRDTSPPRPACRNRTHAKRNRSCSTRNKFPVAAKWATLALLSVQA